MANDYFAVGSVVNCKTCYNEIVEGEVLAYDHESKMLAIKCPSATGKHSDIQMLNLKYLSDNGIRVITEPTGTCAPLASIDLQKVAKRKQRNIEEKRRKMDSIGIGVTPGAQALFNTILKTIREVKWDGENIVFMDQVVISPPYGVDDCRLIKESGHQALDHVRKIINKHCHEEGQRDLHKSQSASPSSSVSS